MKGAVNAWTPEQIEAWLRCDDETAAYWIAQTPARVREAWIAAWKYCRAYIVQRVPECDDYQALAEKLSRGWPALSPPTPEETRAHIDRGLAALWQQSLSEPEATPS
jgi:hypothetical protein